MKEMIYSLDRLTLGEVLDNGVYDGYEYAIVTFGTHPCAYIRIPEGHMCFEMHYDNIPLYCHGGLTYSSAELPALSRENEWWIGWDYAHAGDYTVLEMLNPHDSEEKKWTTAEILEEVKESISHLKSLEDICIIMSDVSKACVKMVTSIVESIAPIVEMTSDMLFELAPVSKRVKHLARYAKKKRVRKKNMNRIQKALNKAVRKCR